MKLGIETGDWNSMNKHEIIDWLISNEPLIHEIVEKTNERLIQRVPEFEEELREQEFEEHKKMILDEISKTLAVPANVFEETVEDGTLKKYIDIIRYEIQHEPNCLIYVCTCKIK